MRVLTIGLLMSGLLLGVSRCEPLPTGGLAGQGGSVGKGGSTSSPGKTECGPSTCQAGESCCNESCGICTQPGEFCTEQLCFPSDVDAGSPGGEPCGPVTCGQGQVCCNESCGLCTEPGGSCTEQFCAPGEEGPFCGGIAGIPCPGGGSCVDDPGDGCNPNQGGADCGGTCECQILALCIQGYIWDGSPTVCACMPAPECQVEGLCIEGYVWDSSPEVCDCVPAPEQCLRQGLCVEGYVWDSSPEVCDCVPVPHGCAAVTCLVGSECRVQDDGSAVCVSPGPRCGGQLTNPECPGLGSCIDDPTDTCDLESDEACTGVCACDALAKCMADQVFDSSPEVCTCVAPLTNACAAVLCPQSTRCEEQPVQCIRAPCPAQAICVPL